MKYFPSIINKTHLIIWDKMPKQEKSLREESSPLNQTSSLVLANISFAQIFEDMLRKKSHIPKKFPVDLFGESKFFWEIFESPKLEKC